MTEARGGYQGRYARIGSSGWFAWLIFMLVAMFVLIAGALLGALDQ